MAEISDDAVRFDGLSCTCFIRVHESGPVAIHFCPLHKAAPQMLAALEKVANVPCNGHVWQLDDETMRCVDKARAAARRE